jgi:alkanesulfonate monooxygenase SsuD/methylene tetrahydromethanopterin reductase-like flavin-dependent oxidoreductase (luciferase family)
MFDGPTMLAGLAARTKTINFGLLVGGVTYHNPAQHAKITTTLDIISGGRAMHRKGAGGFEDEHKAYGFDFPPLKERFERLRDHLNIVRNMFTNEQSSHAGQHLSTADAYNNPQPLRGDIPIVIGGSGERKTLRLVAEFGDGCNLFGDAERAKHLLGVLQGHCDDVGRDIATITKTNMASFVVAETEAEAKAKLQAAAEAGLPEDRVAMTLTLTPDGLRELGESYRSVGIEGLTFSLPDVHDLDSVRLAGATLAPLFNP